MKRIIIAGGCFWGVEEYFRRLKGIVKTQVGYVNSKKLNITYEEVCLQKYDAIEVVQLSYDDKVISLDMILNHLFRIIDPTSKDKQGGDVGVSYRVGAYYTNDEDYNIISEFVESEKSKYDKELFFEIKEVKNFTEAEEYHQKYLVKNPSGYCHVDFSKANSDELK